MPQYYNPSKPKQKKWPKVVLLVAISAAIILFFIWHRNPRQPLPAASPPSTQVPEVEKQAETKPPIVKLQPTIDSWAAKQSGSASVAVYDLENDKYVGLLRPDKQYFTASLYKIYVAYVGYLKVADGTYKLTDSYLPGYNRGECLDAMISASYSPCGEKMWNELGKASLTSKMKAYGLTNTSLVGLQTTARDASIILGKLYDGDDLTKTYRSLYLDSMLHQPKEYRLGLPKGFSHSNVYNKVGWNLNMEYHDAAIVTLPNKRHYVVCILTSGVGSSNIVALSQAIETKLSK